MVYVVKARPGERYRSAGTTDILKVGLAAV